MQKITKGALYFPVALSKNLSDLILKMLTKNPEERITIPEIAQHPWIKDCRYAFYMTDNFLYNPKYRCIPTSIDEIDHDVEKQIKLLNVQTDNLEKDIIDNAENDLTMFYKILKKKKIIQMIGSSSEIRMMYNMKRSNPVAKSVFESPKTRKMSQDQPYLEPRRRAVSKSTIERRKQMGKIKSQVLAGTILLPALKNRNH